MAVRVKHYTTTLPHGRAASRLTVASVVSVSLHLVLLFLLIRAALESQRHPVQTASQATERPIQLDFAPPRPKPTPRPSAPQVPAATPQPTPPAVPLTPGPDETPGSRARVTPTPEERPNAAPDLARSQATRPDPGEENDPAGSSVTTTPPAAIAAPAPLANNSATLESEAKRLFGRPSSKLGPVSGTRDNRPWESPVELSHGCSVPEEQTDSTVPKGMAVVEGRIFKEGTSEPLAGARLQILGTQYGTFSNGRGEYRLVFDRTLVDRCRTQSVRVSAPGYGQRDVILSIGERISSDVWLPRGY
ncbi:MAG TPA: hypothetical protein VLD58_10190 [Gemmatimonadales bacterium]|nr:hypothetical protein [Gemmatimonadales bacterium]